jgi:hypothetical protein
VSKTINQLSTASSLSSGDQIVTYSSANGDARKASLSALLDFFSDTFANPQFEVQTAAPTSSGFTVALTASASNIWAIISPTGGFAAGTVVLPAAASAVDGQEVIVTSRQAVTSFSVTLSGALGSGIPTAIQSGGFFALRFNTLQNTWFCVSQSLGATSTFSDITVTGGLIKDLNGGTALELARNYVDPGPVANYVRMTNRAAGGSPAISAIGSDTNIGLTVSSKGTGALTLNAVSGDCAIVATTITLGGTVAGMTSSADVAITGKATTTLGVSVPASTVAALPAAASNTNIIRIVTDANATTSGGIVAGGGANRLLVVSDGTNWRIG